MRCLFPIEDPQGEPRRRLGSEDRTRNKATGTAVTEICLHVDHDRPIGGVGKCCEAFIRDVGCAGTVKSDAGVDDCRINGQCCNALPDLRHWQADEIDELELVAKRRNLILVMATNGLSIPGVPDQGDALEVRHKRARSCDSIAKWFVVKRPGYALRKVRSV